MKVISISTTSMAPSIRPRGRNESLMLMPGNTAGGHQIDAQWRRVGTNGQIDGQQYPKVHRLMPYCASSGITMGVTMMMIATLSMKDPSTRSTAVSSNSTLMRLR